MANNYGLSLTVIEGVTYQKAPETRFMFGLLNSQLNTAMRALGTGILPWPDNTSFQASIGTGLNLTVQSGAAISPHPDYGAVGMLKGSDTTVPIPSLAAAAGTYYLFATCDDSDPAPDSSATTATVVTGVPIFTVSPSPTSDIGTLLCEFAHNGSVVTEVNDRRIPLGAESGGMNQFFSYNRDASFGLLFAYYGGVCVDDNTFDIVADGDLTLTASATNYIEQDKATGAISKNTSGFTSGKRPLYRAITNSNSITSLTDLRTWAFAGGTGSSLTAGSGITIASNVVSITDGGVTDAKIGDRTIDQAIGTTGNTGPVTTLFSRLAKQLKAILGGSLDWNGTPPITLTQAKAHVDATAPHAGHLDVNGSKALTGNLNAGGNKLTNLGTPTASTDAATKGYADALASGISLKAAVKAAATGNITLSGPQTIDSVSLIAGDRALVPFQTTQSQNGIYIVNAGAWTRASDADADAEMPAGTATFVEYGTTNGGKQFVMITPSVVVGTTAQEWTVSSAGGGESNTTSNAGTGVGLAKAKTGVDLPFKSLGIASGGTDVLAWEDGADEAKLSLDQTALDMSVMSGIPASAATVPYADITDLPDEFTPEAHAANHQHGGDDEIASYTPVAYGIPKAGSDGKLNPGYLPALGGGIPASLIDAKGDLLFGTAPDTVGRLGIGALGQVLTADPAETTGAKWSDQVVVPDLASQSEAETGTDNTTLMTPLRTAQAIEEQRPLIGRQTITHTTASLANNDTEQVMLLPAGCCQVIRIESLDDAWICLYRSKGAATADSTRLITVDPTWASGCFVDVVTASGAREINLAPSPMAYANEGEGADTGIWARITNKSGSTSTITVDITFITLETAAVAT